MAKRISISDYPLWANARKKRTMLKLTLELTTRCNNNCIHCFNNLPSNDQTAVLHELSVDKIKKIVDQALELGVLWVTLTGGEILLREDFEKIYQYIKSKGILISVLTNATLIAKEHIELFKKYPPRDIEITAYGASQALYTKITRAGHFLNFLNGINQLQSASIPFTLKAVMMKSNYQHLKEISTFCKKRSPKKFRFDPFLILRSDNNSKRNKDILNQRLSPDEIINLERSDPERTEELENRCRLIIDGGKPFSIAPEKIFNCGAGMDSAFISSFGFFRLCHTLVNQKYLYDLNKGSLKEAWEDFAPHILSLKSEKPSYQKECGICKLRNICMCCPAVSDLETGEPDEKIEYFCEIANKRYAYCI